MTRAHTDRSQARLLRPEVGKGVCCTSCVGLSSIGSYGASARTSWASARDFARRRQSRINRVTDVRGERNEGNAYPEGDWKATRSGKHLRIVPDPKGGVQGGDWQVMGGQKSWDRQDRFNRGSCVDLASVVAAGCGMPGGTEYAAHREWSLPVLTDSGRLRLVQSSEEIRRVINRWLTAVTTGDADPSLERLAAHPAR